jgi:NADH:ubiquinone oxidoreductase subunit 4 (subunit M)
MSVCPGTSGFVGEFLTLTSGLIFKALDPVFNLTASSVARSSA